MRVEWCYQLWNCWKEEVDVEVTWWTNVGITATVFVFQETNAGSGGNFLIDLQSVEWKICFICSIFECLWTSSLFERQTGIASSTNQHHHSETHLVFKPLSSRFCRTISAFSSLPTVPQKRRLLSPSFANVFMVFNAEPPVCDFKNVHLRKKQKQKFIKNLNFINDYGLL